MNDPHTPGPWEPAARLMGDTFAVIELRSASRPDALAFVPTDLRRPAFKAAAEADARLIASAPRLLAEARRVLLYLESVGMGGLASGLAAAVREASTVPARECAAPEITADRVDRLAAELQREADRNGYAMLLIVKRRPLGEYAASPYGVPEAWADEWERNNHERRIVPAGRGDGQG